MDFETSYIRYYKDLETSFINTLRYVDLREDNFNTHSIEFQKLILATCSEIDSVAKFIGRQFEGALSWDSSIRTWGICLQQHFPQGFSFGVKVEGLKDIIYPWKGWHYVKDSDGGWKQDKGSKTPRWWLDYNSIKHGRLQEDKRGRTNYRLANLKNALYSLTALLVLEYAWYTKDGIYPASTGSIFEVVE